MHAGIVFLFILSLPCRHVLFFSGCVFFPPSPLSLSIVCCGVYRLFAWMRVHAWTLCNGVPLCTERSSSALFHVVEKRLKSYWCHFGLWNQCLACKLAGGFEWRCGKRGSKRSQRSFFLFLFVWFFVLSFLNVRPSSVRAGWCSTSPRWIKRLADLSERVINLSDWQLLPTNEPWALISMLLIHFIFFFLLQVESLTTLFRRSWCALTRMPINGLRKRPWRQFVASTACARWATVFTWSEAIISGAPATTTTSSAANTTPPPSTCGHLSPPCCEVRATWAWPCLRIRFTWWAATRGTIGAWWK